MATIDYMVCAYGPYSASATGGNGWSRDFIAGVLTVPATPFFTNIAPESGLNVEYACTILACISMVLVLAVYVIYWKGPTLRKRSKFAQALAAARDDAGGRRVSVLPEAAPGGGDPEAARGSVASQGGRRGSVHYLRGAYTGREQSISAASGRGNSVARPGLTSRGNSVTEGTARPQMADRKYTQERRFFGENRNSPRETPRATPKATPAGSRAGSPKRAAA